VSRKESWIQAYAVVRRDHVGHDVDPDASSPPAIAGGEYAYTIKEVVLSLEVAEAEVERLRRGAGPGVRYFWQGTHLFLDGGSHGGMAESLPSEGKPSNSA